MQTLHVGDQLLASARLAGDLCFGTVIGGVCCQFARLPGEAFTTLMCIFAALFLIPASIMRVRCATAQMRKVGGIWSALSTGPRMVYTKVVFHPSFVIKGGTVSAPSNCYWMSYL